MTIWKIRRNPESSISSKPIPPIGNRLVKFLLGLISFPNHVVRELNRKRRQLCPLPLINGSIQLLKLTHDHADGPPIADDMVESKQQNIVIILDAEQPHSDQGPFFQTEGARCFGRTKSLDFDFPIWRGQNAQIGNRDQQLQRRNDQLRYNAVQTSKGGPEDFVARHNFIERLLHY